MGYQSGAVYVYNYNGTIWEEKQKLSPLYRCNNATFGSSIALSNNTALIGAPHTNIKQAPNGAVYCYNYNGKTWGIEQTLIAPDSENSLFGWAVALQNNVLVVSAPLSIDTTKNNGGSVYVFRYDDKKWVLMQKIESPDSSFAYFGAALSLHNDQLWVSDGNHAVYQYNYQYQNN